MPNFALRIETDVAEADVEALRAGLSAHAGPHLAIKPGDTFAIFAREGDRVVGGIVGESRYDWLFVKYLWVADEQRGRGLGTEFMAMAEAEAIRRGCIAAYLDTMEFQAHAFYTKLGYRDFGVQENYPPGHTRYFMSKQLGRTGD